MNTSIKIGLACFFGAFIGAIFALEISGNFWWLGMIVGTVVGYLSYEIKTVYATIKNFSLAEIRNEIKYTLIFDRVSDNHFFKESYKKVIFPLFIAINIVIGIIFAGISYLSALVMNLDLITIIFKVKGNCFTDNFVQTWLILSCIIPTIFYLLDDQNDKKKKATLDDIIYVIYFTPALLLVSLIILLIKGIISTCPIIKKTLIFIHSDIRILCATSSAIGTAIGYFSGNAIIGGIAGAFVGIVQFQLISVRWLKLNKAELMN